MWCIKVMDGCFSVLPLFPSGEISTCVEADTCLPDRMV